MKSFTTACLILTIMEVVSAQVQLKEFIPTGYSILDTAVSDLNGDGCTDYLLVLRSDSESQVPDAARPLLILHGKRDGSWKVVAENDSIVLCSGCGGMFGDPYEGISIRDSSFAIAHYGGSALRWSRIITFQYEKKLNKYVLYQDKGESFHATEPDKTELHTYNRDLWGKVEFEKYNTMK